VDATEWDERYASTELVWSAEPNRWLAEEVAGLRAGTALDLGAGEGRNAVWLAERGWQVTAVDFSREGLAKLQRRADAGGLEVTTVCEDLLAYEPAQQYDLVAVVYIHLPADERRRLLATASAAVAAGGTLIVIAHDATNLTDGYGGPPDAAVLFTPDDAATELSGSGLDIEKAERVRRPVDTPEGPRVAIDLLVRARRDSS
jgi:SAM-dependent methyltransferase